MKAIVTIIILLLVGLAAWLVMRDDEIEVGNNPAAAVQAIQEEGDEEIDLGEFQDKG